MRWIAVAACVGFAIGCGPGASKSLLPVSVTDAGSVPDAHLAVDRPPPAQAADAGTDGAAARADGAAAGAMDGSTLPPFFSGDPPSDGGVPVCAPTAPPGAAVDSGRAAASWSAPTKVPFSCDPLPEAFFFPRPSDDTPGVYARCASFTQPTPRSLAISHDGSRVAVIGYDGIARIVDVASHMVVGVLAPPRSSIDRAAFSPSGDTLVTVDRGARVATLWRADSLTPIWSTTFPGRKYFKMWAGAAAFSPDGSTLLISPGADLYLVDVATGAIRATRNQGLADSAVVAASYGWGGRRIVTVESPIGGMCARGPIGGTATVVDPETLAPIATAAQWAVPGDEGPAPAPVLVAAEADLMLTSGLSEDDAGVAMFRISDGQRLPAPRISGYPLLLTADGTAALFAANGMLQLENIADGTVTASTAGPAPTVATMSGDGTTIATASPPDDVLAVWRPGAGSLAHVCAPASYGAHSFRLSPDGQMVAVTTDAEVRLLRRADGALVSTLRQPGQQPSNVSFSPSGRYAVVDLTQPRTTVGPSRALFQTADGAKSADLDTNCEWPTFSSDDAELDLWCSFGWRAVTSAAVSRLAVPGALPLSVLTFTGDYISLVGNSAGCPVVVSSTRNLAWRACGSCSDQPFATTSGGVLSADGAFFLGSDVGTSPRGSTLWRVLPAGAAIRQYPPRPDSPGLDEVPIAVSTHGDRVITTGEPNWSCAYAPGATNRVQDVATGTVVDELPPGIIHESADLSVIAFDSVLWCAR